MDFYVNLKKKYRVADGFILFSDRHMCLMIVVGLSLHVGMFRLKIIGFLTAFVDEVFGKV